MRLAISIALAALLLASCTTMRDVAASCSTDIECEQIDGQAISLNSY